MATEFRRDYLVRLPLPLAQLYSRSHNAADARSRHDNTFYLFEALVKLAAAPAIAAYLNELAAGAPRVEALDRLLAQLALPSLGQWLAMLRELARHFAGRPDAASHPLGHLAAQLTTKRRDVPAVLALYQRIKNGPDGEAGHDQTCSLLQLFDALVQYRNGVFGHGAGRFESFYSEEMGPLLFPAVNEVLADGVFDFLGPRGSRLVYLTELRTLAEDRVAVGLRELVGLQSERLADLERSGTQAATLFPNRVAVLWPGRPVPLRLDPLLLYRESDTAEDLLFLNRDRSGRQVEYLSYSTGRTERDRHTAPGLARLLSLVVNRPVSEADLNALAQSSHSETPSVEELLAPVAPAGRVLGEYEVLAELGRGGMGVVYLAKQLSLGRLVALKMLPADLAGDEVALGRFRREIRQLARCEHPHIVKVFASGTLPDGQLYYTMEYVPGCDLERLWRELSGLEPSTSTARLDSSTWRRAVRSASSKQREKTVNRGRDETQDGAPVDVTVAPRPVSPDLPLSLPEFPEAPGDSSSFVRWLVQHVRDVASALETVHARGLVHRDVKPANLMLTPDGHRIVLMDFGLVKGQTDSGGLSRGAGFLGTLRYAAPEQLAAATLTVGPPADVRALGGILWEFLTLRRLFGDAEDEKQLAAKVHDEDVPRLRQVDAGLDRDLEALVARATERRVVDRLASAGQLAEYLQLYLDGKPLPIRPPSLAELARRWVWAHKSLVSSAALGLLAVLITIVVAFVLITLSRNKAVELARANRALADDKADLAEKERQARQRAEVALAGESKQRNKAEAARRDAVAKGRELEATVYLDRILLANREWYANHSTQADSLLDACRPGPGQDDLRGWEWHYLKRRGQSKGLEISATGPVSCLAWSRDSKFVTGTSLGAVSLWMNQGKGKMKSILIHQHRGTVHAVVFSPDAEGRYLVSASRPGYRQTGAGEVYLWDLTDIRVPVKLPYPGANGAAFHPASKVIALALEDGTVRLWDRTSKKETASLRLTDGRCRCVAYSPDGKRLAAVGWYGLLRVWDTETNKVLFDRTAHSVWATAVAFSPDPEGRLLATAGRDRTVKLWNGQTGDYLRTLWGHTRDVESLAFHPRYALLATAGEDQTVRVWQLADGKEITNLRGHRNTVHALGFLPGGDLLAAGDSDGSIKLWPWLQDQDALSWQGHPAHVMEIAFSANSRRLASTGSDFKDTAIKVWDPLTAKELLVCKGLRSIPVSVAFSPDGKYLAAGSMPHPEDVNRKGEVKVWDAVNGTVVWTLGEDTKGANRVRFSPDGRFLAWSCDDGSVRLWSLKATKQAQVLSGHPGPVTSIAFRPDGKQLATLSSRSVSGFTQGEARIWDLATNKVVRTFRCKGALHSIAFSPNGQQLAASSGDREHGEVTVWDLASKEVRFTLTGKTGRFYGLAFSKDGRRLITAGEDGQVKIQEVRTGREILVLEHRGSVYSLALSPDGSLLAAVGGDYLEPFEIRVWDGRPMEDSKAQATHPNKTAAVGEK